MRKYGLASIGLGIASVFAATAAHSASTSAQTIASVTTTEFRVVLTARRGETGGGAPSAAITATTSRHIGGKWRRTAAHRLQGTYFWHTVTGPRAVCRFELRTAGTQPRFQPYVVVQLLVTPSLGCGRTSRYRLS